MPKTSQTQADTPQASEDVQLSAQYGAIGSAAILAALACKMKKQDKKSVAVNRTRRAA